MADIVVSALAWELCMGQRSAASFSLSQRLTRFAPPAQPITCPQLLKFDADIESLFLLEQRL